MPTENSTPAGQFASLVQALPLLRPLMTLIADQRKLNPILLGNEFDLDFVIKGIGSMMDLLHSAGLHDPAARPMIDSNTWLAGDDFINRGAGAFPLGLVLQLDAMIAHPAETQAALRWLRSFLLGSLLPGAEAWAVQPADDTPAPAPAPAPSVQPEHLTAPLVLLPAHYTDTAVHAARPIKGLEWHDSVLDDGNLVHPPTVTRAADGTLRTGHNGDQGVIVRLDVCGAFAVADVYEWEPDERAIMLIGLDTLPASA